VSLWLEDFKARSLEDWPTWTTGDLAFQVQLGFGACFYHIASGDSLAALMQPNFFLFGILGRLCTHVFVL